MSTSTIASYAFASKQLFIYAGTTILITGVLGGILTVIVFLSFRTFRESSCAFYLTIMSLVNIGQLLASVLSRIIGNIYGSDGTDISLFYCKFRISFITLCTTLSATCFCLATIDQYCATCSRPRFQQLCNIKLAQRVIIIFSIIWILHSIPYWVFYQQVVLPTTGKVSCVATNAIFTQYRAYIVALLFNGFLPVCISVIFGLMAYRNLQQLAHYTLPLVRRELDKQLTMMVLTQVLVDFFVTLPFAILNALQLNPNLNSNPLITAQIQLCYNITLVIYYLYFANAFYIYICVSERFRRQLIYVLLTIHFNRFKRQARIINNQVIPQ